VQEQLAESLTTVEAFLGAAPTREAIRGLTLTVGRTPHRPDTNGCEQMVSLIISLVERRSLESLHGEIRQLLECLELHEDVDVAAQLRALGHLDLGQPGLAAMATFEREIDRLATEFGGHAWFDETPSVGTVAVLTWAAQGGVTNNHPRIRREVMRLRWRALCRRVATLAWPPWRREMDNYLEAHIDPMTDPLSWYRRLGWITLTVLVVGAAGLALW